jgi:hypothetical protein
MEHSAVNPKSRPDDRTRPLWARAVVLAAIWTMVLQPAVSSAQLAQSPMFTVTSAPPNVMLMFDDSASMNRVDLNPPPAYANPTFSLSGTAATIPVLKLNTVGYYGISGMRWYKAGDATYDNHWQFGILDATTRSPAFNPLAYNPAIQYLPWNNNGVRFPVSSIGGTTNVPVGALTEWDPRNLPPSMGGGTVFSKLALPRAGVIDGNGETRSWAAPVAGSVAYTGIPGMPVLAGVELDLFNSTIVFDNPNCGGTAQDPTTYAWYCPGPRMLRRPGQHPDVYAGGWPQVSILHGSAAAGAAVSGDDRSGGRSVHVDCRHRGDQLDDRRAVHGADAHQRSPAVRSGVRHDGNPGRWRVL